MLRFFALTSFGLVLLSGCASTPSDEAGEASSAATPEPAASVFDQLAVCELRLRGQAFRDLDLRQGVLRWQCGDVEGVTMSACEADLDKLAAAEEARKTAPRGTRAQRRAALELCADGYGQEYCEYNAVTRGHVVNSVAAADRVAVRGRDAVECVFTGVHADVGGDMARGETRANRLASQLKDQLTAAERVPEMRVAAMRQWVNSREAADMLIEDCSALASSEARAKDAERQTRCFRAAASARTERARKKLETACRNVDLSDDAAWAATGLDESAPLGDPDRDLAACSMILFAANGGQPWRNSDPTICARSYRAARECGVRFRPIRDVAPDFQGFSIQGWSSTSLPTGCRFANVDGAPSSQIVVCKLPETKVAEYRNARNKKPLQTACREVFGLNVAMQAPVGLLSDLSEAREETPFCRAFVGGARSAQRASGPREAQP